MGSWHETCGVTGLPIVSGDPVRMMAIRVVPAKDRWDHSTAHGSFDLFQPITVLAKGKYNDYGWIEFDTGEERRFFESALAMGIGLNKEEDDNPEFPPDHYQWMVREDAYEMLDGLPLDHWSDTMPKSVGEGVRMKRALAKSIRTRLAAMDGGDEEENFQLREQYNEIFGRGEMPHWPLKQHLHEYRFKGLPSLQTEAVSDAKLEDLLSMWKVFVGLSTLRKVLAPTTTGLSSQDWNEGAFTILGDFYGKAVKKWQAYMNEDDDAFEDEEDAPAEEA